jgi:site-specific DNA recombinase
LAKLRADLLLPWTRPPYGYRLDLQRPRDPALVRIKVTEAVMVTETFAWYNQQGRSLFGLTKHIKGTRHSFTQWQALLQHGPCARHLNQPDLHGSGVGWADAVPVAVGAPVGDASVRLTKGTVNWQPPKQWTAVATIPVVINQEHFELSQAKLRQNQSFARRNNKAEYLMRWLVS